jgi:hypothetical protein
VAADGRTRRGGSHLVLEGAIILVSILAAFWLEGWRADRDLARDLTQEMESVYRELERNRDLVIAELAVLDRVTSSADALLMDLRANPHAPTVAVTDTIAIFGTSWSPTIDPSLGAVQALIGSGRLAQVPNPELRQGLAGLSDQFQDALEEEVLARAMFSNEIFPLTRDRLDYRVWGEALDSLIGSGNAGTLSQEGLSTRPFPSKGAVDFPNSLAIRNALEIRRQWYVTAQDELSQLRIFVDSLITVMEGELAAR